jgi:hypothetical protein
MILPLNGLFTKPGWSATGSATGGFFFTSTGRSTVLPDFASPVSVFPSPVSTAATPCLPDDFDGSAADPASLRSQEANKPATIIVIHIPFTL